MRNTGSRRSGRGGGSPKRGNYDRDGGYRRGRHADLSSLIVCMENTL